VRCTGTALGLGLVLLVVAPGRLRVSARELPALVVMFAFGALFWAVARPWWSFDSAEFAMTTSLLGVVDEVAVPVWMGVAWVIVLGTLAPYSLNIAALRHVAPTIVGAVGMCEPVAAAAVAWAWLGQALRPIQMVGGGVVLAGVAIAQQAATSGSHVTDVPATVSPELRISR
jgi:drug/metabolite transporter (DMT)-like permease